MLRAVVKMLDLGSLNVFRRQRLASEVCQLLSTEYNYQVLSYLKLALISSFFFFNASSYPDVLGQITISHDIIENSYLDF